MRTLLSNYYYLIIIIIIINYSPFCQPQRLYKELITEALTLTPNTNQVINNNDLPLVKDELSITLKINIMSNGVDWTSVFHKGRTERTPSLWLTPNDSSLHPRYSTNSGSNAGIMNMAGYEILLNQWYHIAYTLSNPEKRMDIYIGGKWVGFSCITLVQNDSIIFNDAPLYIGNDNEYYGINGQISNFRYYNFALSRVEVEMDYLGQDPTTSNGTTPSKCQTTTGITATTTIVTDGVVAIGVLAGSIVGSFFCGMIFLAGGLFMHKIIKRR